MNKKIIGIMICMILFSLLAGIVSSTKTSTKILSEMNPHRTYSHSVFVEVATSQNCKKCHNWNQNIHELYSSGDYDFEYVEMIGYDHDGNVLNEKACDWINNYNIFGYPTSILDGDYKRLVGNYPSQFPDKVDACGNRYVRDISVNMTVSWLGDATIIVNITIQNNEGTQYNGYIRASITEIESRYDTYYGDPYHFGFLDYAFDTDISINPGGVYTDDVTWDGNEHQDAHGDDFSDITPGNIQVTMGVFNNDNNYVDETVTAYITHNDPPNKPENPYPKNNSESIDINPTLNVNVTDPDDDTMNVSFYNAFDDSLIGTDLNVVSGGTATVQWKGLSYNTQYSWYVIANDSELETKSDTWSFTTKEKDNNPPFVKIIKPENALYLFNSKIRKYLFRFRIPLIIGKIRIEADATDEDSAIEMVEFYINDKPMGADITEPYTFLWRWDRPRIFHIFTIKVVAYDNFGNTAEDKMLVRKIL